MGSNPVWRVNLIRTLWSLLNHGPPAIGAGISSIEGGAAHVSTKFLIAVVSGSKGTPVSRIHLGNTTNGWSN